MAEPTPTIYSYYTPEVRTVVRSALATLNSKGGIHDLLQQNYDPGLDTLHEPLLGKYERFARSEGVIGLDTFDHKYFTNGSSEGIFHLIQGLPPAEPLYQFVGEYQGYKAFADARARPIITVKSIGELMSLPAGILIMSNPASKDGNIFDPRLISQIGVKHRIILDLAYMGMTHAPLNLDLTAHYIAAVVGSLSKPFGLYYYRIGFCYSRYPIASLFANKWFKNALSIKLGEAVLDHFASHRLDAFKDRYFDLQTETVERLNRHYNLNVAGPDKGAQPSDVWLLANAPFRNTDPSDLRPFKRYEHSDYRFCLTPYYMEMES